jgi:hypothetical protein
MKREATVSQPVRVYSKLFEKVYEAFRGENFSDETKEPDWFSIRSSKDSDQSGTDTTTGKWYSSNKKEASNYSYGDGRSKRLLKAELEIENPLKIDAEGREWWEVPVPDNLGIPKDFCSTDELAVEAKKLGKDALIVQNVYDDTYNATDYVALDKDVIKQEQSTSLFEAVQLYNKLHELRRKQLREEKFFRGYQTEPLFDDAGMKPNDGSPVLYLATDADHAFMFAESQTTKGDKKVFEVYDIPVENLKIYNLQDDPDNIQEPFNTGKYDTNDIKTNNDWGRYVKNILQSKGYDGWTKIDRTHFVDEDASPFDHAKQSSRTWELALFQKDKYKPIERITSKDEDWNIDELRALANWDKRYAASAVDSYEYEQNNAYYDDDELQYWENAMKGPSEEDLAKRDLKRFEADYNQGTLWDEPEPARRKQKKTIMNALKAASKMPDPLTKKQLDYTELTSMPGWRDAREIIDKIERDSDKTIFDNGWDHDEWLKAESLISKRLNDIEDETEDEEDPDEWATL